MILLPGGRCLLVELKSEKGRLRTEQQAVRRQCSYLGHVIHVIRSYKRFLEVVKEGKGEV